ncbi:MAG: Mrp/NBP35 family ATP-binding protein [Rickettsiaceae bacterium]|nr:Mrp/NBP35 family ATP-binding protein [Rickettsiaceae bacterium]
MTNLNKLNIQTKIKDIVFSDGSTLLKRASDIIINGTNIGFSLDITGIKLIEAEKIRKEVIYELSKLSSNSKINIIFTSQQPGHLQQNNTDSETQEQKSKIQIEGVKEIIMVAAGKGGVGKSTISALLAHKLTKGGAKVGIIDADIYGPSIPKIFNLNGKPELENNRMIPLESYGVAINSIGFLVAPDAAISWRGPMTSKALYQLLSLTNWPKLDYLIVDTPPGTGDIHLSLLQNYLVHQVIMVTTPQQISAIDVSRAINLYKKFEVKVTGIIENMSYYLEQSSGQKINLFAGNSGKELAKQYQIPLLCQIPINPALSNFCDQGEDLQSFTDLMNFTLEMRTSG